jgi:hypothetical protein
VVAAVVLERQALAAALMVTEVVEVALWVTEEMAIQPSQQEVNLF